MIPYPLHVALLLILCLLFYKALLQRETFFRLNRFVLLSCLLLSFGLPLLRIPQQLAFRQVDVPGLVSRVTLVISRPDLAGTGSDTNAGRKEGQENLLPPSFKPKAGTLALWGYWLGVGAFGFNFLLQLAILLYRANSRPAMQDGPFRIVEVTGEQAPCSFWHTIFINPALYDWDTYTQILAHEKVHARQYHSLDLLLMELVRAFQWFNPGAWLFRREVEGNLEFLTDQQVLQEAGWEKSQYQRSLFNVSAPHFPLSLTSNYNQSLLKRRLLMMNRKRSSVSASWKYLVLIPVLFLAVSLLNQPVSYAQAGFRQRGGPAAANPNTDSHKQNRIPSAQEREAAPDRPAPRPAAVGSVALHRELVKDGVIPADTKRVIMSWVEGRFTVNGQLQPAALAQKYRPLLGLPDIAGQELFITITVG